MAFTISTGTKNYQPVWTVVEIKNGRVIETCQFFDQSEAYRYIQSANYADRNFAMES